MTTLLTASVDSVLAVLVPLIDEVPAAEDVHTGWWYVLVIAALIAAMVVLWRSLRKQLKRINFDEQPARKPGPDRDDHGPA